MNVTIEGTPKEIADLVLALQSQLGDETQTIETYLYSDSPKTLLKESLNSVLRESTRDTNEEKPS